MEWAHGRSTRPGVPPRPYRGLSPTKAKSDVIYRDKTPTFHPFRPAFCRLNEFGSIPRSHCLGDLPFFNAAVTVSLWIPTQTAGNCLRSVAVHRQLHNGLLDFRFPGIVSVFGIECLMRTFRRCLPLLNPFLPTCSLPQKGHFRATKVIASSLTHVGNI